MLLPDMDPAMKEKMRRAHELRKEIHQESRAIKEGGDAAKAKPALRRKLAEFFDLRLSIDEAMAGRLEKRLAELKQKIERKKSNRDKIIDKRLESLAGESDDDWD